MAFPDFDFKIDCGDDQAVRQLLHNNGCVWDGCGSPILQIDWPGKYLFITDGGRVTRSLVQMDFDEDDGQQINPYDYMQREKKMTVKPFYIRHTPDMTDEQVAQVFDKAVSVGVYFFEGVEGVHKCEKTYPPHWFGFFGVSSRGTFFSDSAKKYGSEATEITLDQVDEWLGIAPAQPTVAERMAALIEKHKDKIPDWARWVIVNRSGSFEAGDQKPFRDVDDSFFKWPQKSKVVYINQGESFHVHWRETLTEIWQPQWTKEEVEAASKEAAELIDKLCINKDSKPDNMAEIAARDERDYSTPELAHAQMQTRKHNLALFAKQDAEEIKTIPSTLPTEQAMPMMLGGMFGGEA